MTKEERLRNIACRGLQHLQEQLGYGQSNIVNKLKMLGHAISTASLSNIKNSKPVGLAALNIAAKGIEELLRNELDMTYDKGILDFCQCRTPGWKPYTVPEKPEREVGNSGFTLHPEGRLSVQEKTSFIATARKEVIEVGVRLNSFSNYFISQKEEAYKKPILELLKKGVDIKGYLLDPDSNEARLYFEDRAKAQRIEKDSIGEIRKVVERLRALSEEIRALQLPGAFEIYLYKHIPYNLFISVDGALETGKMMVSSYLYGVSRANCPVIELTRKDQPLLFRKYLESMQAFLRDAKLIG